MVELREQAKEWDNRLREVGERLSKCVRTRDRMRRQQKRLCGAFSVLLRHISKINNVYRVTTRKYYMKYHELLYYHVKVIFVSYGILTYSHTNKFIQ